ETRVLMAFALSMMVMASWGLLFPPQKPPQPPATKPPVAASSASPTSGSAIAPNSPATISSAPAQSQAAPAAPNPTAESSEHSIAIEDQLYHVELTNRGGVVKSWQLKKYTDSQTPPKILDLVHADSSQQLDGWPLSIVLDGQHAEQEKQINAALYRVTSDGGSPRAPGPVEFEWSDGKLAVTKRFTFGHDYIVSIDTRVTLDGQPLPHAVAWRGGFGDASVYNAADRVTVFYRTEGKLKALAIKKLGNSEHQDLRQLQEGTIEYAGMQDQYFAAAFLPRGSSVAFWHWKLDRDVTRDGKAVKDAVAEMSAGSTVPGPVGLRLFVGPKDLDVLGQLNPPITELVDFGFFSFFAKPLFYVLRWIYDQSWVGNYGWAIVLLTILLNMLLFPLKIKNYRVMKKMQKVAPEIQAINNRYKKYSMRDPKQQEKNTEVMAVYKREGVNPAGGCLPMVMQLPIWLALYSMLSVAIELRHAPWMGWIRDLSSKDPYYILPVLMGVTMYVMNKMTPMTATDPAQQQMMKIMPIMFGGMFVIAPVSSGLVLYILTSNLVGMAQQWYLNKSHSMDEPAGNGKKKK
ncbi:MAG: membrane protein insertase YidC, partial [Acidobacteria bacterium]|nr:membrane protein insertase YidC [Acidobacteriota bacterium]